MRKTVYIIGIGGRTGAMLGFELQNAARVIGVGRAPEAEIIRTGRLKVRRGHDKAVPLTMEVILPEDFKLRAERNPPDFIWSAVRNPVADPVQFYYQFFRGKNKIPALILSQNGLSAINDARRALGQVLGQEAARVRIIRVSLINGVGLLTEGGTATINYKIPVKLGLGALMGQTADLEEILGHAGIKYQTFRGQEVFAMENSKLFTNLVGMAAAANGVAADAGWRDKKIFRQEILMLREYIATVIAGNTGFVANFAGYPVRLLAALARLPVFLLLPFRGYFARIIAKGRNRPKDLSEIDYYNGEVVKLGRRFGVATPVNEEIITNVKLKNQNGK